LTSAHTSAGIVFAVLSAIFVGSGTVVEKVALGRMPDLHVRRSWTMFRSLFGSQAWLMGCALLVLGLACQGLALSLAPLSVAQPIFASGIVFLLVLSHFVLHDRLGRMQWVGLATIVVALVLLGLSIDPHVDRAGGSAKLTDLGIAAVVTCAVAIGAFVAAERADRSRSWARRLRAPLFGIAAGLFYGVAGLGLKSASTFVQRRGVIGAVPYVLTSPGIYLLAVACAVGLLLYQTGLQRCSASVVAPVNLVTSSTYVIAVGTVLFAERLPTASTPLTLRLVGFVGVFAGMIILALSGDVSGSPDLPASGEPPQIHAQKRQDQLRSRR